MSFSLLVDAAILQAAKPDAERAWDLTNLLLHMSWFALVTGAKQTNGSGQEKVVNSNDLNN